jgi:hypothetical protein
MSKGLGYVSKALQAIFEKESAVLTTSELCSMVYGTGRVEKKHRVAVLRSLRILVERTDLEIWQIKLAHEKSDDKWFNRRRGFAPRYASPFGDGGDAGLPR